MWETCWWRTARTTDCAYMTPTADFLQRSVMIQEQCSCGAGMQFYDCPGQIGPFSKAAKWTPVGPGKWRHLLVESSGIWLKRNSVVPN